MWLYSCLFTLNHQTRLFAGKGLFFHSFFWTWLCDDWPTVFVDDTIGQKNLREQELGMNKSELIESLAQDINVPHREAAAITNTVIETMTEALARGESIEIRGFGSFVIKHYESYEGRNPKTGKKIKVKPKKLPFFKVGKDLREQVNANKN